MEIIVFSCYWHNVILAAEQNTAGIVSRTGTAVDCPSPSSPWAANQQPQLFSTSGWRKQHGNTRRPRNTGYHSRTALTMNTFAAPEPRCSLHLSWLCLPSNDPQLSVPAVSKFPGSVHLFPPFSWISLWADGDLGVKPRYDMWILLCSLCYSCILPIKPLLLPSPARKMRSHEKDNQT